MAIWEVKFWVNVCCLTWAWPCERPKFLRPMGLAKLAQNEVQRDGKASIRSKCKCWQCVQETPTAAFSSRMVMAWRLPHRACSYWGESCFLVHLCTITLFICSAIIPLPCSNVYNKHKLSFQGTVVSSSESRDYLIPAFLYMCLSFL